MRLGLIGFGNIGRTLCEVLAREGAAPAALCLLRRPGHPPVPGAETVTRAAELVTFAPDLVIECAGAEAVAAHAAPCLAAGIDTVLASVGALADPALETRLCAAARAGRARLILPAGALGGVDLVSALRTSGIERLRYTGRKPPAAWAGSAAEELVDLRGLTGPVTFFQGSAREAARRFPKNANVAATLALAGPGLEATEVRLVADPGVTRNVHEVSVRAGAADMEIRIEGRPSPENPRTSLATVHSLAREVLNRRRVLAV
mgnify:CR=1 FL=1